MSNTRDDFDLIAHTKMCARDALNSLTKPEEDILPVILCNGPHGLAILGAVMPGDEEGRDELADIITAQIAVHQAREVSMVCPAYMTVLDATTGEVASRQEHIILVYCGPTGMSAWGAKVTRHDNRPPDLSVWNEMQGGMIGGRFGEAMAAGLAYVGTTTPDMRETLEQAHADGETDKMVDMFVAVRKRLRSEECRENGGM